MSTVAEQINAVRANIRRRDPDQKEFLQAVEEVFESLAPVFEKDPQYLEAFERLVEPERQIVFRVPWIDDAGKQQVNRGFRVQMSSALGPYKGGLRFHPTVNLSVIKFLAFEQTFKNSLTTLMMGAGKGGSDFDPRGRSDREVMAFCQSFMTELHRHIGSDTDVPAGDINVGAREIGFLFGQYKRLANNFTGVLTGKDLAWGGSLIRPEATGYGCVYFAQNYLAHKGEAFEGKRCIVSGSGNVAQYTAEKLLQLGAVPITFSDSNGYILEPNGFTQEQIDHVKELKNVKRVRISEYCAFSSTAQYFAGKKPWEVAADYAFPSATQNEIDEEDAKVLAANGVKGVFEGANMPSTNEAIEVYKSAGFMFGPAKAANAGGVAVSGLEMAQNSQRLQWTRQEVDDKLEKIMKDIFNNSLVAAERYGLKGDIQAGANIAGFIKVADSMISQGCV
ncbi:NADP-specific glutamate dehydrogenase [Linderina pennispora]|uniref:Glutamate dehydrogenase n=1 Tax=Linderina pennispora TaxID=61395 RepID=A0A1Y1WLW2_9FUNG|nr:NADP-specific glutamate dehydrogenase [Linderina pennispora]XP_040747704.1 NADP-specific glutamate dehydrogenase [Linderina pennispora]ORX64790.1 NADP-specific glutamate dehydrogenase [Linderina pennispora]ORX74493.1 NADP-specific glutamate dehydrogenase [Linderina pennispora]